jgi:hypothetical protein
MLASTYAVRVNTLTAFLFVQKEQCMDEQGKSQHQPPPPEPTPWQRFLVIAKEEVLWLAHTLGVITVTLVIGRIISRLGLDMSTLTGGASWQDLVNKALNPDKKKEPSDDTNKHVH